MSDLERGTYQPLPPPQQSDDGGNAQKSELADVAGWAYRELMTLWEYMRLGRIAVLEMEPLRKVPERPQDYMVCNFVANVPGVGVQAGLYEFVGGTWKKL